MSLHYNALRIGDSFLLVRFGIASLFGIAIAGLLTLFMHILIEFSQHELDRSTKASILDFVRVKREESSQPKKLKPKRPETQDAPPTPPAPQTDQQNMSDAALQVSIPSVPANVDVNIGGIGIGTGDGEYLPIVKVAPAYPVKAAAEGIEGSCLVEFTVTVTGATRDVEIVPGQCLRVFMRPSIAAAKKFKYKPRVIDGEAIEVPNVRNLLEYTLQDREDVQ